MPPEAWKVALLPKATVLDVGETVRVEVGVLVAEGDLVTGGETAALAKMEAALPTSSIQEPSRVEEPSAYRRVPTISTEWPEVVEPERVKAALPAVETEEILPDHVFLALSKPSRREPYWIRRSQVRACPLCMETGLTRVSASSTG